MPTSPFTITAGSNTVVLNDERKGKATFTVTNISGRPLRGRSILQPLGQTAAQWLSIAGEAERDFGIAATQQYVVQVAVPLDAAPGTYTFRLDEVGVDDPDENFTQGPGVAFQVASPPPPPPPPRPFPWWIVAVAVGVIVLGVVVFLLTRPRLGNFDGTWQANFGQLVLTQSGSTVSGTVAIYGFVGPIPMTGTVNGSMLIGRVAGATPYTLTLTSGGSFDGYYETPADRFPWCGVRSGALPAGCGFSGRWNLAGAAQTAGAFTVLTQTSSSLSGTFFNGTINGQVFGTITGWSVSGQFANEAGGTGPFRWTLVNFKSDQFQGNWSGTQPWCGFRTGLAAPSPCLATLLPTPPTLLGP